MRDVRTRRIGIAVTVLLATLALGTAAAWGRFEGSEVVTGNLILKANGAVVPNSLPRGRAAG